jgi:hypothetical protein
MYNPIPQPASREPIPAWVLLNNKWAIRGEQGNDSNRPTFLHRRRVSRIEEDDKARRYPSPLLCTACVCGTRSFGTHHQHIYRQPPTFLHRL